MPGWFARINRRFHSPTNAYFAYFLASVVWIFVYNYVPGFDRYTLGVTFASGYVFSIGSLAAAFLPYRARLLYEHSPGSRYKLLGRPGVTYLGLLGAALGGAMVLSLALVPAYGLRGAAPLALTAGILALSLAWFNLAARRYRPLFDSPSVGGPNGVTRTDQRQGGGL
jgi:amino acid transporter